MVNKSSVLFIDRFFSKYVWRIWIVRSLTAILIIPALVTACSMQEIADTNNKISHGASGIMNSLRETLTHQLMLRHQCIYLSH